MKEFSPGRIIISSAIALIAMYSYKHTSHKMVLEMDQEDAQKLDSRVAKSKTKANSLANKNKDDSSSDKLSTLWRRPSSVGGELPTKEASSADLPSPEGTDDELPTPDADSSEVASSDPGADAASGDSN